MSNSNVDSPPDESTIFSTLPGQFPTARSDEKIKTKEFLDASQGVVMLIGKKLALLSRKITKKRHFREIRKSLQPCNPRHEREYQGGSSFFKLFRAQFSNFTDHLENH